MFRIGYNTNGMAHHRIEDALELLAELGYEAVSLTPDPGSFDPLAPDLDQLARMRALAEGLGLELTVETGSRYLLDPWRKHFPTLLENEAGERERRIDFLERSVDLAAELGAGVVSCWSGKAPDGDLGDARGGVPAAEELWERLTAGMARVLDRGRRQGVQIAFEPEPGMFLERPSGYAELVRRLGSDGDELGLCLDVGHCLCSADVPVEDVIRAFANRLVLVHLDDVKDGVHEHRMFGEGDLDLPAVLRTLLDVGFEGVAAVELSRDSHRAPLAAAQALQHIQAALAR